MSSRVGSILKERAVPSTTSINMRRTRIMPAELEFLAK
jgi:hypothetical protein